jgi:hypothetical protein
LLWRISKALQKGLRTQKVLFSNNYPIFAAYFNTNPVFVRPGRRRFLDVRERILIFHFVSRSDLISPPHSSRFAP